MRRWAELWTELSRRRSSDQSGAGALKRELKYTIFFGTAPNFLEEYSGIHSDVFARAVILYLDAGSWL